MKGKGNGTFRSKLSESFVKGVIALVFLMIGYQTAVFMHSAAVLKIAADRDVPDTVVIYAVKLCFIKHFFIKISVCLVIKVINFRYPNYEERKQLFQYYSI